MMLQIYQDFGIKNNLQYSTDPDPVKSKTKCLYMCGKSWDTQYPVPLVLFMTENFLGSTLQHILAMSCTSPATWSMMLEGRGASSLGRVLTLGRCLGFANTAQVLSAVNAYT